MNWDEAHYTATGFPAMVGARTDLRDPTLNESSAKAPNCRAVS